MGVYGDNLGPRVGEHDVCCLGGAAAVGDGHVGESLDGRGATALLLLLAAALVDVDDGAVHLHLCHGGTFSFGHFRPCHHLVLSPSTVRDFKQKRCRKRFSRRGVTGSCHTPVIHDQQGDGLLLRTEHTRTRGVHAFRHLRRGSAHQALCRQCLLHLHTVQLDLPRRLKARSMVS